MGKKGMLRNDELDEDLAEIGLRLESGPNVDDAVAIGHELLAEVETLRNTIRGMKLMLSSFGVKD